MRFWRCSAIAMALWVASCSAAAPGEGELPSATQATASHGLNAFGQTASEMPPPEALTLASTETVRAQLQLTSTGLTAELVRDSSGQIHRAEALWGHSDHASDDPVKLGEGDLVEASFTTTLDLGGAGEGDIWAVAWQLIGPDSAGAWPPPPLALTAGNGKWRVGGGDGYPGGSRETYVDTGVPFRDGETIRWDVRVALEHGAGSVDVWADGIHVVEGWQPPGGTMYPDQPHVLMKTGLYTGGGGAAGLRSQMEITDATAALYEAPDQ